MRFTCFLVLCFPRLNRDNFATGNLYSSVRSPRDSLLIQLISIVFIFLPYTRINTYIYSLHWFLLRWFFSLYSFFTNGERERETSTSSYAQVECLQLSLYVHTGKTFIFWFTSHCVQYLFRRMFQLVSGNARRFVLN